MILENAHVVSAGFNNTFVIKTDSSLWGFGDNMFSQLGDGTAINRHEPIQIIAGNEVIYNTNNQQISFETALFNVMPTDENYMISPFSLRMALAMVANGASGESQREILAVLGIDDLDLFNQATAEFIAESNENEEVEFNIANSIWFNEDLFGCDILDFSENYRHITTNYFAGVAQRINAEDGADIINDWIAEQTRNRITNVISDDTFICEICEPYIDEVFNCPECITLAILVNAIYFNGDWASPFNPVHTRDDIFTDRYGIESTLPFMEQLGWWDFYRNDYFQMMAKPYADDNIRMYLVLPNVDERLPFNMFVEAISKMRRSNDILLRLPRFTIESMHDNLVEILQDMGIQRAFEQEHFDFVGYTNMIYPPHVFGEPLFVWIEDILQKTFIEVDEVGTEAAAVTVGHMIPMLPSIPPPPIPFYCDRPFIFFIRNDTTGDILFMGEFAFAE